VYSDPGFPLIANDFVTMLGAARRRGACPDAEPVAANAVAERRLVQVLEPYAPMAPGVFVYYSSRSQMLPKLRAFIDHVKRSAAARGNRGDTD